MEKKQLMEDNVAKIWSEGMRRSLIAELARHRCLIDPSHPGMRNRVVRANAYKEISNALEAQYPGTTHLFLNGGINRQFINLKTYFQKLKKAVQNRSGDGTDDIVDITWPLYNAMDNLMRGIAGNTPSSSNYRGSTQTALNLDAAPRASPSLSDAEGDFARNASSFHISDDGDSFRDRSPPVSPPSSSGSAGRGNFSHPLPRRTNFPRSDDEHSFGDGSAQLSPPLSSGSTGRGSFSQPLQRRTNLPRSDDDEWISDRGFQPRPLGQSSAWMLADNPSHPPPRRRRGQNASAGPWDPRQQMYASVISAANAVAVNRTQRNDQPKESSNAKFCQFIEREMDALPEHKLHYVRQKIMDVLWESRLDSGESSQGS